MKKWQELEKKVVEMLGGKHHQDSGKHWWNPGDGHTDTFAIEVKTGKKQVLVTAPIIEKIRAEGKHRALDWLVVAATESEDPNLPDIITVTMAQLTYRLNRPDGLILPEPQAQRGKRLTVTRGNVPYGGDWVFYHTIGVRKVATVPVRVFRQIFEV